ncbi:hypothetical protein DFH07DRAFT_789971 [Mycena maculata]|uniref:Uncharacterized protein n=1 Tax=Mycena maculata TaxID=230809 RepID=A0AAD7KDB1_9AGAR|nr:hypothetical protein DFH07DRAFT_789971 [Mycena maculata]
MTSGGGEDEKPIRMRRMGRPRMAAIAKRVRAYSGEFGVRESMVAYRHVWRTKNPARCQAEADGVVAPPSGVDFGKGGAIERPLSSLSSRLRIDDHRRPEGAHGATQSWMPVRTRVAHLDVQGIQSGASAPVLYRLGGVVASALQSTNRIDLWDALVRRLLWLDTLPVALLPLFFSGEYRAVTTCESSSDLNGVRMAHWRRTSSTERPVKSTAGPRCQ